MQFLKTCLMVLLLVLFFWAGAPLADAKEKADFRKNKRKLNIEFLPYVFIPFVDTDLNISGQDYEGDEDIGGDEGNERPGPNLNLNLQTDNGFNFGLLGRLEVWSSKLGFIFDGKYLNLDTHVLFPQIFPGANLQLPPLISLDTEFGVMDFLVSYRVFDFNLGGKWGPFRGPRFRFEPYGGARWYIFSYDIDLLSRFNLFEDVYQWVEPTVGGALEMDFTKGFTLITRGDVSGFGLGNGTDLTWSFASLISYRFPKLVSLYTGYQFYGIDLTAQNGPTPISLDAVAHGPYLGFGFYF